MLKNTGNKLVLVGWGLTALLTQFRSYRAFKVKSILQILKLCHQ